MSATDTPLKKPLPPLTRADLEHVEEALGDLQIKVTKAQDDGSVPPAMFGATGPMSVPSLPSKVSLCS